MPDHQQRRHRTFWDSLVRQERDHPATARDVRVGVPLSFPVPLFADAVCPIKAKP